MDPNYSKRELDTLMQAIHETLVRIEGQTTRTNGRVTRLEKTMLIFGAVTLTLLIVNGSKFVEFVGAITQ